MRTIRSSTIPLGMPIISALATRCWRILQYANPPTSGAAMVPATLARMRTIINV